MRVRLPGRLLGAGVRGAGKAAERAGLDEAIEETLESAVIRALESPAAERALERALQSPALERAIVRVLDSELTERVWDRLLASDEAQKLVERIARAPEVRAAVAYQGVGLLEELRDQLRTVVRRLDGVAERVARRLLFRRQRAEAAPPQAGIVSRALALAIDVVILNGVFVLGSALVALAISAIIPSASEGAPALAIGTAAWVIAGSIYLLGFWSLAGQTPGMRFTGLRLRSAEPAAVGRGIGLRSAFRRLIGMVLAALPLLLGFVGVLTDDRRRGLHDRYAHTEVDYEQPRKAPWATQPAPVA